TEQSVELVPVVKEAINQPKTSDTQLKQKLITISQKPKLTPGEIAKMADSDVNIKILLSEMQTIIGRTLSSMEQETLASLYSYAGIQLDYILLAATYCVKQDKRNIRYIEKTILSWVDEGVDTYEKAEQHIQKLTKRGSNESLVRASIGIHDRQLTAQEKKYIQSWCDEMCFDAAMVKLAYEKTINNIGKISFPYTNTILTNWHSKGIKTPKQAMEEEHPNKSNYTNQQNNSHEIDELEHFIMYGNKKQ
ncbi:MAG: DnaD domain protein, partial [Oscillospiraceae bacterium]